MLLFIAFGAARVVAPVTLIGLVFDDPGHFAIFALIVSFAGAVLLFIKPIEARIANVMAPSRAPTPAEQARIGPLLAEVAGRAGIRPERLIVRVQEDGELNASAGASHLLFITTGALRREDDELEALIAHELGHHRGLHPVAQAVVLWLSIPGELLVRVYVALRRLALRLTGRGSHLAVAVQALIIVWQFSVLWLHYIAGLFAYRAERLSEFSADHAAAKWGYAEPLARLLASMPEEPPEGLLARLTATHPPTEARIERLAAA